MAKRKHITIYGNVIECDGRRVYSSFGTDLSAMIEAAETRSFGVIAIEAAHQSIPPVWTRSAHKRTASVSEATSGAQSPV